MDGHFIAVEIGGTKLQLVLGDGAGGILQRRRFTIEAARGATGIRDQIERELPGLLAASSVRAVGVGFGGPVDWRVGRICCSHQVEGWSEFDLRGWLEGIAKVPVAVDNDANVAALGEAKCGAGRASNPMFYVTLGSGVGGGLVCDGRIFHGAIPGEAEIGHIRLDRNGTILEKRCSGWAVDRKIRELVRTAPDSGLARKVIAEPGTEAKHLSSALAEGDPVAQHLLEKTATDLAFGLSHVTHLFHPEMIVLGGGLSKVGEPLLKAVRSALAGFLMEAFAPGPQITQAALGEDAVPVGALLLAAGHIGA